MRPCTQMAMMRSQKNHRTAALAHQKKHLTIDQSIVGQELVKRKYRRIRALSLWMKKQIEIRPNQSQINGTNRGKIII